MKKTILFLFLLLINLLSAQTKENSTKSIKSRIVSKEKTFSGNLTGFKNGDKIKFYDPEIMKTLDSTYIIDGKFTLKNPLGKTPKIIFIIAESEKQEFYTNPFIAGENIIVSGDKKDFRYNLNIKGSKYQQLLCFVAFNI